MRTPSILQASCHPQHTLVPPWNPIRFGEQHDSLLTVSPSLAVPTSNNRLTSIRQAKAGCVKRLSSDLQAASHP